MDRLMAITPKWAIALFVLLDVFSIGMGMGVPFFTIPLGVPVGWFSARRAAGLLPDAMRRCLRVALSTSAVTLVVLCAIWLPWAPAAWGTKADLLRTGIPMILYEPRASFIGWLVLMLVISPMLQALVTLSTSYVTLMRGAASRGQTRPDLGNDHGATVPPK